MQILNMADVSISLQTIADKFNLKAKDLDKPCEDRLIPSLANFVHPWRVVTAALGLSEVDAGDVDSESNSGEERRIAALRKWKTRNGQQATYKLLVDALIRIQRVDTAEKLCHLLADDKGMIIIIIGSELMY